MGRKVVDATKARLIRRTRGDGGLRRLVVFVPLRADEVFEEDAALLPTPDFVPYVAAVLALPEVFGADDGACASP